MLKRFLAYYRSVTVPSWTIPLAILSLGLIAYGLQLPRLGFYWDDWAKISVPRLFGPDGYSAYYAEDRPLSAWTHLVFNALLGETPLAWQLFQFALVIATTWVMYRLLIRLWPHARWQAAAAALLFLVHPAFLQHAPSVTFHQQWLQYLLFLFSAWMMLEGVLRPRWYWPFTALALILSALQLTVTEYFVPLELIRPLLLWVIMPSPTGGPPDRRGILRRVGKVVLLSAPYLVLISAYIVYRLFFIQLSGDDPYRAEMLYALLQTPLPTLLKLALTAIQDSIYILATSWTQLLATTNFDDLTRFKALSILLAAACSVLILAYLRRLDAPDLSTVDANPSRWGRQAVLVGLAAFLLGVLPAWITGREVVFDFHSDRYALPALFGASLLVVEIIQWLAASRLKRALLISLLIGIGVEAQLGSANDYHQIWQQQLSFYWQLYWRAPYISPGTALVTETEVFPNQGLFSSSSALNLLYPQQPDRDYLAYWWYTLSPRYQVENLPDPLDIKFQSKFRNLSFQGSSQRALLVHTDAYHANCLWVLSDADQDEPVLDDLLTETTSLSNLSLIKSIGPLPDWRPPQALFGPEPQHDWCYYFEKGELYAQFARWEEVAELGDQARLIGYNPYDSRSDSPHEWQPFIQAYAHLGRWDEAALFTLYAVEGKPEHYRALCNFWQGLSQAIPYSPEKSQAQIQVNQALACMPPRDSPIQ